jgi:hypothetical protein
VPAKLPGVGSITKMACEFAAATASPPTKSILFIQKNPLRIVIVASLALAEGFRPATAVQSKLKTCAIDSTNNLLSFVPRIVPSNLLVLGFSVLILICT